MIDYMHCSDAGDSETSELEQPDLQQQPHHLLLLSAAATSPTASGPRTMQLQVEIQGQFFLFLVDSGSLSCFIDQDKATLLTGCQPLPAPVPI
jgi:hypothetical protein